MIPRFPRSGCGSASTGARATNGIRSSWRSRTRARLKADSNQEITMSAKVSFLGLGVMGFPMAGHLKAKGYDATGYNRTPAKAQAWVEKHGGKSPPPPAA